MVRKNNRVFKHDSVKDIVEEDRAFQKWIAKTPNEYTTNGKRNAMRSFIFYLHKMGMNDATPTNLITHTLAFQKSKNQKKDNAFTPEDFESVIFSDDDEIGDFETIVTEYKGYVLSTLKPSAAKTSFLKIINFYKNFKVDVSNIDTKINAPVNTKSKKAPDFKLLQKAFDKATDRDKCIISCGITSGMARADITTLSVGEFEDGLFQLKDEEGNSIIDSEGNPVEVCVLERNRVKSDIAYHTFLAPETVRLIKNYLGERNDPNQDAIDYTMRRVYSPSDKIFIKLKFDDIDEILPFKESIVRDDNGKVIEYDESMRILKPSAVTSMYYRLRKQAKIPTVKGEFSPIRSHAMRHYFSNVYKKIDPDFKEHWMGHGGDSVKITYEDYDPEEGLDYYLQGLDAVTIMGDVNMISMASPSVTKMQAKYEDELQQRDEQISSFDERMKILESKDEIRDTMDEFRGVKMSYYDPEKGKDVEYTLDDDSDVMQIMRKTLDKLNAKLSGENYEDDEPVITKSDEDEFYDDENDAEEVDLKDLVSDDEHKEIMKQQKPDT